MAEGVDTLVTPQMREALDAWSEPSWSLPIEASDIRRWAIATYYPEQPPRLFWDEEYAKTTRWGGIIAPPEFNPFAWQIDTPTGRQFWEADNNLPRPQTPPDPNAPGQHGRKRVGRTMSTASRCGPATASRRHSPSRSGTSGRAASD